MKESARPGGAVEIRPSLRDGTLGCHHDESLGYFRPALRADVMLEGWSVRARLGNSPTTLLEEFARIQSTDVVAPTTDSHTIRLRCVGRPDKAQAILLEHLGLKLPQRLRLPRGIGRM